MRVSRQWRDLKYRKWHGFGHEADKEPTEGGLALFCSACAQEGINIPDNWKESKTPWVYTRTFTLDGNFEMNKLKSKRPTDDVFLSDGKAFLVEDEQYQAHIKLSRDIKQDRTCNQHRAVTEGNLNRRNLESTGCGAAACARHGCWIPRSVVDFQKGER
jgi:hypothetical protein